MELTVKNNLPELVTKFDIIDGQLVEFTVENNLPEIVTNFEVFKGQLVQAVSQYEISVTTENVKEAKKMMADLNKIKGAIKTKGKEAVDEIRKPVVDFQDKVKELVAICDSSRAKISEQVQVFEDETKDTCRRLITELRDSLRQDLVTHEDFYSFEVEDLIKISSLTAKGHLTKQAKEIIEARCNNEKANENAYFSRLSFIENSCVKAGVEELPSEVYSPFMALEDEADFKEKITSIVEMEVRKVERIKEQAKADAEKKADADAQRRLDEAKKGLYLKSEADARAQRYAIALESEKEKLKAGEEAKKLKDRQDAEASERIKKEREDFDKRQAEYKKDGLVVAVPVQVQQGTTEKKAVVKIYPSSLKRIFACNSSRHAPEIDVREEFSGTQEGVAVHKFVEIWSKDITQDIKPIIDDCEILYDVDISYLCYNAVKLYRPFLERLKGIQAEVKVQQQTSVGLISGYIDLLGFAGEKQAVIFDTKAGFLKDDHAVQLKSYALAIFEKYKSLEKVAIVTVFVKDSEIVKEVLMKSDVYEFEIELEGAYSRDGYTVGSHCTYCPSRMGCQARAIALKSTAELVGTSGDFEAIIKDKDCYNKIMLLEKAIKTFKTVFKTEVEARGEIRLGVDTYYIEESESEQVPTTKKTLEALQEVYSDTETYTAISKTRLKERVMRDAKRGQKSTEWKAFIEGMREKGLTETIKKGRLSKK